MNPKINILILNWNGSKYLIDLIRSINKNTYSNYKITVIDNNSDDDSLDKINKEKVKIISHKYNYKYAKDIIKLFLNLKMMILSFCYC